ncbi:MAG: NAD-dependent dehydratase [Flavobacteriaceae bacterium]|nr:NAD-dependent dehydratase [Flavobacteriaceae bacterium]|tara:strand:+ start:359 stop:988 length:630 start_codon:yes stop_codon:yes gene_type:complete
MEKVLVAGATGTTGNKVINLLKEAEHYIPVAMVRKASQQTEFESKGVAAVLADLTEDLSGATKGIDKVIFAAGSKGKNLKEVDQDGAKELVDSAKANSVKKFVMLSAIGADRPEESEELQDYLKAKQNADKYLQDSRINYTIVRPGTLNNDNGTSRVNVSKRLKPEGEIPREDVARVLVASLDTKVAQNKTFELLSGETEINSALQQLN